LYASYFSAFAIALFVHGCVRSWTRNSVIRKNIMRSLIAQKSEKKLWNRFKCCFADL